MNIILGATGQIGSLVIENLLKAKQPVTVVVRDASKAESLKEKGVIVKVADYFDGEAMKKAFQAGEKVFLLTPENPFGEDVMGDASAILKNYHDAMKESNIKKIVGLSSFGAGYESGTGNLEISYKLEHTFEDLDISKTFIRPSYYYSNWMGYYDMAKESGILPTFFPAEQKIPMIAPADVAFFVSCIFAEATSQPIYEITGPKYSANDIAEYFGKSLGKEINALQIPHEEWETTLIQNGFTPSGALNLALMIDAVVSGKTRAEGDCIMMPTTFPDYVNAFSI